MRASSRTFFALVTVAFCFLLPGCGRPGFVSDKRLKDRFSKNRADYDELVRLMKLHPQDEIRTDWRDNGPPTPPADATTWNKIHGLLIKLHSESIAGSPDKIIVDVRDAWGFDYWFVYRTTAPSGLVPSLEQETQPGKPRGIYGMRLDDNWYAYVFEDK